MTSKLKSQCGDLNAEKELQMEKHSGQREQHVEWCGKRMACSYNQKKPNVLNILKEYTYTVFRTVIKGCTQNLKAWFQIRMYHLPEMTRFLLYVLLHKSDARRVLSVRTTLQLSHDRIILKVLLWHQAYCHIK